MQVLAVRDPCIICKHTTQQISVGNPKTKKKGKALMEHARKGRDEDFRYSFPIRKSRLPKDCRMTCIEMEENFYR